MSVIIHTFPIYYIGKRTVSQMQIPFVLFDILKLKNVINIISWARVQLTFVGTFSIQILLNFF